MIELFRKAFFMWDFCRIRFLQAMATKQELDKKKKVAYELYKNGHSLKEIAILVSASDHTVCKWAKDGMWSIKKTGGAVTRAELVVLDLEVIHTLLTQLKSGEIEVEHRAKVIDQISKLSAAIEKLENTSNNVVTVIEVFTALNRWLRQRMEFDEEITPELLQTFDHYQALYIKERLSEKE